MNNHIDNKDIDNIKHTIDQYNCLRHFFNLLIKDILGDNYYNNGLDMYEYDKFAYNDLKNSYNKLHVKINIYIVQ